MVRFDTTPQVETWGYTNEVPSLREGTLKDESDQHVPLTFRDLAFVVNGDPRVEKTTPSPHEVRTSFV